MDVAAAQPVSIGWLSIQMSSPAPLTSCRAARLLPTISMHCKEWLILAE